MYLIKTAKEWGVGSLLLEVCSTLTFCSDLVSMKVLGVQMGRICLCYFVNLLRLCIQVGPHIMWEPLVLRSGVGKRSVWAGFVETAALSFACISPEGLWWASTLGHSWISLKQCCSPGSLWAERLFYPLVDSDRICLCTRCSFESCKTLTLLYCTLVSWSLQKLTLVAGESSRSGPCFR